MTDSASGKCLCGNVRFEFALPTLWCAHCHCSLCRRAHGAGFVTWVGVDAEHFRVTTGADGLVRYASSHGAYRSFCGNCGSTLLFESERWPGEVHVALANIDSAIDRAPAKHAHAEDHALWIPLFDLDPGRGA